jgi:hypothetical protein
MNNEPEVPAWTVDEMRVELDRYEEELHLEGKPRNTITSYVYPVDRFLKWLDEPYRPIRTAPLPRVARPRQRDRIPSPTMMADAGSLSREAPLERVGSFPVRRSRYDGLREHLSGRGAEQRVSLTFAEISELIGRPGLPQSAHVHRAWWANERSGSHSHARSWLDAIPARRTENVDLNGEMVDFVIEATR